MTAFLRLFPPARRQYRVGRRARPTGCIVLHTAETPPDFEAPDGAAEAVAQFIRRRTTPGSYHRLVDSDSIVELVDFADEAFHDGTGSNRWSIGLSVATFAASWSTSPDWWVGQAIEMLASAAAEANDWLVANGYPPCEPRRISKVESDAGKSGFISHGDRDPARRTDPGVDFPWEAFLAKYAELIDDGGDDMADPHTRTALATLALSEVYDLFGDRKIESSDSFKFHLTNYLEAEVPAQYLTDLASALEQEG